MDGVFIRRKVYFWLTMLLCAIFFIGFYIFLNIVDSQESSGLIVFLIAGIICILIAIPDMLMNHDAYIRIEGDSVKARYGLFAKLDCELEDVDFVFPQLNTLTILLKNIKRHVIVGVENSWTLSSVIRGRCFEVEEESPVSLQRRLSQVQTTRRKELCWVIGGCVLMFINIFIAVLLTNGKDPTEFDKLNWFVFSVMAVIELLTVALTFYVAQRCGRQLLIIEQLKYRVRGALIATCPLPNNNVLAVYTEANNTGRIVVCGFPNSESAYYIVEDIVGNYELEKVYTSGVFSSIHELPNEALSAFVNISDCFEIRNNKQPSA